MCSGCARSSWKVLLVVAAPGKAVTPVRTSEPAPAATRTRVDRRAGRPGHRGERNPTCRRALVQEHPRQADQISHLMTTRPRSGEVEGRPVFRKVAVESDQVRGGGAGNRKLVLRGPTPRGSVDAAPRTMPVVFISSRAQPQWRSCSPHARDTSSWLSEAAVEADAHRLPVSPRNLANRRELLGPPFPVPTSGMDAVLVEPWPQSGKRVRRKVAV